MKKKNDKTNVAEQARRAGLEPRVLYARLNNGWSMKRALGTPVAPRKKQVRPKHAHTPVKKPTPVNKTTPKDNKMVVEHYEGNKTPMLVWAGLVAIIVLLLIIAGK